MKLSEDHRYHVIGHPEALKSYADIGEGVGVPDYLCAALRRVAEKEDELTQMRTMRVLLSVSGCLADAAVRNDNEAEARKAKGSDPSLN